MNPHLLTDQNRDFSSTVVYVSYSTFYLLQPPLTNLDGMFQHIDKVMDVSGRLLSLLDQAQVKRSDPQYLETLCKYYRNN